MGAELSCDRCQRVLAENEHVWERHADPTEHVCQVCFFLTEATEATHALRSVYGLVGQENARRLQEQRQRPVVDARLAAVERRLRQPTRHCARCSADTVVHDPAAPPAECFCCGAALRDGDE